MPRITFLFLVCGLLLTFAACDDTSNVGLGLVGEQGQPEVRQLNITEFEPQTFEDITSAVQRVLTGEVDDPLTGLVSAEGFVDFTGRFGNREDSTITEVILRLVPDYIYGDTTAMVTLQLRDVLEEWSDSGLEADTSFATADMVVTEVSFLPTDSVVVIPLPEAWVIANDTTLKSSTFAASLHGFSLRATESNAVVGFDALESRLQVLTPTDTVAFALSETFSHLVRPEPFVAPEGRLLLQDGISPTVRLNFDLSGNEQTPVNGVRLTIAADIALSQNTPPNFVRPLLRQVQLARVAEDGSGFVLGDSFLDDDGSFRFESTTFRSVLQQTLLGETLFDHFEVRFDIEDNTINSLFIYGADADENVAPNAFITVSPID